VWFGRGGITGDHGGGNHNHRCGAGSDHRHDDHEHYDVHDDHEHYDVHDDDHHDPSSGSHGDPVRG
jgi:hypothetical protein